MDKVTRHARGALRIADVRTAAVQFLMLCHGDLVLRAQLGILGDSAEHKIQATVQGAVAVFVRAYQPTAAIHTSPSQVALRVRV